jgi:hypothetical protein
MHLAGKQRLVLNVLLATGADTEPVAASFIWRRLKWNVETSHATFLASDRNRLAALETDLPPDEPVVMVGSHQGRSRR